MKPILSSFLAVALIVAGVPAWGSVFTSSSTQTAFSQTGAFARPIGHTAVGQAQFAVHVEEVPEPGTYFLMGSALLALGLLRRPKK